MTAIQGNVRIVGRATSPGIVEGPAFVYRERSSVSPTPYEIERHQVGDEMGRIEQAIGNVLGDLKTSARRIEKRVDEKLAAIFHVHGGMLQDPLLRKEIRDEVEGELVNAEHALARVFRRWERKFHEMTDETQRKRAEDVADLRRRLLREMTGVQTTALEKMPTGRILVARRLLPSDTVALPRRSVLGIVVEFGGPGSHAALLARGMGIPTVAQIAEITEQVADGDLVLLDGFSGEVIIHPDETTRAAYRGRIATLKASQSSARRLCHKPARTVDGTIIKVLANVACREDSAAAADNGADGVGLCRIEQYYLSRKVPPTAEELLAELGEIFSPLKGKPITVRLLDLGGDKPLPFLKLPSEENPFLGRRGVRLLLHYPDLITTQLKALLELTRQHDIRILVPMVTLVEDVAPIRQQLTALAKAAGMKRIPPLGAMIETPAAALTVGELLQHVDFLSIGTNDLTQFTMAAGRENHLVSDYFREDHLAVLRLVKIVVEESRGAPIDVCGELAGQLDAVPKLLQLGVRALSVAPPLAPDIKEAIRGTNLTTTATAPPIAGLLEEGKRSRKS